MNWRRKWDMNPHPYLHGVQAGVCSLRDSRRNTLAALERRARVSLSADDQQTSFIQQTLGDSSAPTEGGREESEAGS